MAEGDLLRTPEVRHRAAEALLAALRGYFEGRAADGGGGRGRQATVVAGGQPGELGRSPLGPGGAGSPPHAEETRITLRRNRLCCEKTDAIMKACAM